MLTPAEVDAVRRLRAELIEMDPAPAAARIAGLINDSTDNQVLLEKL